MTRFILLSAIALALVGCTANTSQTSISTDHPAHPGAQASPAPAISSTLALDQARPATAPSASATPNGAVHAVYVCPMHPEVVADAPGKCPKCGMALVKKEAAHEHPQ